MKQVNRIDIIIINCCSLLFRRHIQLTGMAKQKIELRKHLLTKAVNRCFLIHKSVHYSQFPKRGSIRLTGVYADQDYRQIFVKKYAVLYRVRKEKQEVHIVTVRYAPSQF